MLGAHFNDAHDVSAMEISLPLFTFLLLQVENVKAILEVEVSSAYQDMEAIAVLGFTCQ
jgi:hypothetical protein